MYKIVYKKGKWLYQIKHAGIEFLAETLELCINKVDKHKGRA